MLLLNLVALILADRVWAFYVQGILRKLGQLMTATGRLDFSVQEADSFNHAVLERAQSWRDAEAARLGQLRERIRQLPAQLPTGPQEREALAQALASM
jgi:hypothetical protein